MRNSKRLELFEKLRHEFCGYLTSMLWKLTGNAEIFAEAIQYAFLAIWMNLEKLTGPQAGAYIYRIALSANSKAWRTRIGKDGQIPRANAFINPATNCHADEETVNLVRKEIANLPEKQAQAIVLRYIDQHDYQTIADKLSCTEDTARSHVSKALNALRNNLAYLNISES
ncbi:MAG: sigma-70 family RNA polymerase sigma factor [Sedimentisphaerales bacterium]|nr:sigma-70 family RNA polymerase sigma factor [Sedimentisphaerales bacterium]